VLIGEEVRDEVDLPAGEAVDDVDMLAEKQVLLVEPQLGWPGLLVAEVDWSDPAMNLLLVVEAVVTVEAVVVWEILTPSLWREDLEQLGRADTQTMVPPLAQKYVQQAQKTEMKVRRQHCAVMYRQMKSSRKSKEFSLVVFFSAVRVHGDRSWRVGRVEMFPALEASKPQPYPVFPPRDAV
jgi:hypothetical protein